MQRGEMRGKKRRDIIHYFLMHIVLHTYIMVRTLTEGWPHSVVLAAVCVSVGAK